MRYKANRFIISEVRKPYREISKLNQAHCKSEIGLNRAGTGLDLKFLLTSHKAESLIKAPNSPRMKHSYLNYITF